MIDRLNEDADVVITEAPQGNVLGEETVPMPTGSDKIGSINRVSQIGVCDECTRLGYEEKMPNMDNQNELLLWAARHGHAHYCRDLLYFTNEGHYSIKQTNCEGLTPLHLAARRGHIQVVQFLVLDARTPVDHRTSSDDDSLTALHLAVCANEMEVVEFLATQGSDINARDSHGYTPAMFAAQFGHLAMLHMLRARGADLYAEDEDGGNVLLWTADRGHTKVVTYLVDVVGMDINMVDSAGMTSLHWAVYKNRIDTVRKLLHIKGISLSLKDSDGYTPEMYAKQRGHSLVLKCLHMHQQGLGEPIVSLRMAEITRQSPAYLYPMLCLPTMLWISWYTASLPAAFILNTLVMSLLMALSTPRLYSYVMKKGADGNQRNPSQANFLLSILLVNPIIYTQYVRSDRYIHDSMETYTWGAWAALSGTLVLYFMCRTRDAGVLHTTDGTELPAPVSGEGRAAAGSDVHRTGDSARLIGMDMREPADSRHNRREKSATCTTCCIAKPPRAKHCRFCNRCVAQYDHHCFWTNNCVGQRNTRVFFALVTLGLVALYLYNQVLAAFVFASRPVPYVGFELLHYSSLAADFAAQPVVTFSLMMNTVAMYMVLSLWLFHAYLMALGLTTNEYNKPNRHS